MPRKLNREYRFSIHSQKAHINEDIHIRLEGCEPNQIVTIRARTLDESHNPFESYATLIANSHGIVDLSEQRPRSGTYDEVDRMGLFWSMEHNGKGNKMFTKTKSCPITIYLTAEVGKDIVAGAQVTRTIETPNVHKIDINKNGLVGTLYRPKASKAYPAVIILGGSDGAIHEQAAALLATQGYVALSLAYFGVEGLPKELIKIPLEYFEEALRWLGQLTFVDEKKLGVIGFSRGAELALLLGSTFPSIKTIIAASPNGLLFPGIKDFQAVNQSAWTYQGKELPYFPIKLKVRDMLPFFGDWLTGQPISNLPSAIKALEDRKKVEAARIPVENITCPVLLLSGDDDQLTPASKFSKMIIRNLQNKHSKHFSFIHAGHFSTFPYSLPNTPTNIVLSNRAGMKMSFGGNKKANTNATNESWAAVVNFLDSELKNNFVKISYIR